MESAHDSKLKKKNRVECLWIDFYKHVDMHEKIWG